MRLVLISRTDHRGRDHPVRPVDSPVRLIMKLGLPLALTNYRRFGVGGGNESLIDHIAPRRIVARIAFLFWLCLVLFVLQKTRFELSIGRIQVAFESLGVDNGVA